MATTGIFERVGNVYLRATRGSGKRFLLLLFVLVAPLCALLPNATTVVLLAPIIIRVAKALDIDFVPAMILTAIISNSAGLLTLVGDPATFLVGSSIGMSFGEYLRKVSLGGVLAVLVPLALVPLLMPDLWRMRRPLPPAEPSKPIEHPWFAAFALAVLAGMVVLFVIGEELPTRIVPPAVAVIGASLALLVAFAAKIEPVDNIVRDIDWKTLLFLAGIFCLVEAFAKTGMLQAIALKLHAWFGTDLMLVAMTLIVGIGVAVEPAGQRAGGRRLDRDGQRLPGGRERGARDGARARLHRLAGADAAGLHRDDVRRDARRQRDADRRLRQRGRRGRLRRQRPARHVRPLPALRPADHGRASSPCPPLYVYVPGTGVTVP